MVSLSAWIWIMGSVVIATIIIVFGTTMLLSFQDNQQKLFSIDSYRSFVDRASIVCSQSIGNIDFYSISVPDVVRAIYPAGRLNDQPPDKVSVKITNSETGIGRYICMQFFDERAPRCTEFVCNITMTYIGSPSLHNNLADILSKLTGTYPTYGYLLTINKTATKNVTITAEKMVIV